MNKSLKQKRKQKRDAKRELKNHTNQTYTDDSIQETLRQIRLVQNQIIRQNKEKQTHEQKLAQSKNSPEQNTPNVNLKSISFIKNYTSKQNDHVDLQIQKKPTYVGQDGHVHNYRERSETDVYCDVCGDIQSKKTILYFEITPSLHKIKGGIQKNQNPQKF